MTTDDMRAAWRSRQRESRTKAKPPKPAPVKAKIGRPRGAKNKNGSSSQYHHVFWCKTFKRWKVTIRLEGKAYHFGSFVQEIDAAHAADRAAEALLGAAAVLNFPEGEA